MNSTSLMVMNLCVPCPCDCRYCLLSSCREATGVDYERGKAYVQRFQAWAAEHRPDLPVHLCIGYCMETQVLTDYLRFSRETGAPWASFLQLNGLKYRCDAEMEAWLRSVQQEGVTTIDLTFYGDEAYHDAFAGRRGDFAHMVRLMHIASSLGLNISASFPLTKENMHMAAPLMERFDSLPGVTCRAFLPHSKGRGASISHLRLTQADFAALPEIVRSHFSRVETLTEAQWIARGEYPQVASRTLYLVLRPEDMDALEQADFAQVIAHLEKTHDAYLAAMPDDATLARMYGDPEGQQLFRLRDLRLKWQQRWTQEHPEVPDLHDERLSGARW